MSEEQKETSLPVFDVNWSKTSLSSDIPINTLFQSTVVDNGPVLSAHSDHGRQFSRKVLPSRLKRRVQASVKSSPVGQDHLVNKKFWDAVYEADTDTLFQLINQGVNVCGADSKRRTALHFAAAQGNNNFVRVLLEHGANPNAKDLNGNTPLHLAACTNQLKIVTLLLQAGSDISAADFSGKTPLDLALSRLRILQGDQNLRQTPSIYCEEVRQVIDMMKVYIVRLGNTSPEQKQLDDISSLLGNTATTKQIDEVSNLLTSFTAMTLSRKDT